jgi:hypothetical protein
MQLHVGGNADHREQRSPELPSENSSVKTPRPERKT